METMTLEELRTLKKLVTKAISDKTVNNSQSISDRLVVVELHTIKCIIDYNKDNDS